MKQIYCQRCRAQLPRFDKKQSVQLAYKVTVTEPVVNEREHTHWGQGVKTTWPEYTQSARTIANYRLCDDCAYFINEAIAKLAPYPDCDAEEEERGE